ncbi:hypothetical protein KL906_004164 [Ogataea polymorpha]|uniref:NADP-dependent oxidoreductase domain-containing protein n=1 Tax=Ogataea polymorpha TaxID=460523 RepID=A0A9P8P5F6_9ASCO|nr:hypothetical protein KL906_004164 [Ogataea polymorpha]KAH3665380.1 hypothetical protein OGATHE_004196 [Ogataea polymorpha]
MSSRQFTLADGAKIPALGLGTWQLDGSKGREAIVHALKCGYRMLDCAFSYGNQDLVAEAIEQSGVSREDLFIVDKLANTWHSAAEDCLDRTLAALKTDTLDLWLMHWPSPLNHHGNHPKCPTLPDGTVDFEKDWNYVKTWQTMIEIQNRRPEVKGLGVANFGIKELEAISFTGVLPLVNQVELHPSLNQEKLHKYCKEKGIQLVAYSPLGSTGSALLLDPDLQVIAEKNNATVAQCLLSWGVAKGWPVIPRSSSPDRLEQNLNILELSVEDIDDISRIGKASPKRYVTAPWHTFEEIV